VGVAGYPEKHFEAPNMITDLMFLKHKIDAGAEYIVTQMFFDNSKYFEFVRLCREIGITVPIIPGIKPLSTRGQLNSLPSTFHIDIPEDLVMEVMKCKDNQAVRQVGVEWAIMQSRELKAKEAPVIHYFTMGKADNIRSIVEAIF
jgi:methylenetetrahydrofolate reductase (NADPH)